MAIWSHRKLYAKKRMNLDFDRINGLGSKYIPFALDGMRRTKCKDCSKIFYCEKMDRGTYKERRESVKLCPDCDEEKDISWKRHQTKEDEEVYLARSETYGVKISNFKSSF